MTNQPDDLHADNEDAPEVVETTFYVNIYLGDNTPKAGPVCVTDDHLGSEHEAREFALEYIRDNPDVTAADISAYYIYSDGTACGSDSPISYVDRSDLVETDRPT